MTTESRTGIIKSDGTISPESKSTFFDVNRNGLYLAIGSAIPNNDITATIPPVKSQPADFYGHSPCQQKSWYNRTILHQRAENIGKVSV